MSRSGSDYESLHDAVKLAISRGTVVVAAAGNSDPWCDIWSPANYEEVICAAGSTYSMAPWEDSSRGPEVTTAAPAYSVYRARTRKENNSYAFDVYRSSGTSYSTPIVAGAAALWIERHSDAAVLSRTLGGPERIAPTFKYLLRTVGIRSGKTGIPLSSGRGFLTASRYFLPHCRSQKTLQRWTTFQGRDQLHQDARFLSR